MGIIQNRAKNIIINGGYEIDQRNNGVLFSGAGYCVDRWVRDGATTSTQRIPVVGENFKFALESITAAARNTTVQRIESAMLSGQLGKKISFCILMRLDSGSISAQPRIKTFSANGIDDFSGSTLVDDLELESESVMDGTYRKFKATFIVTSTMFINGFSIQFGDFGSATNTIHYAQAQLNAGAGAAPFERAGYDIANEEALCKRYYHRPGYNDPDSRYNFGTGHAKDTNNGEARIEIPVPMRAGPSFSYSSVALLGVGHGSTDANQQVLTVFGALRLHKDHAMINFSVGVVTFGANDIVWLRRNGGTGWIAFDAEL